MSPLPNTDPLASGAGCTTRHGSKPGTPPLDSQKHHATTEFPARNDAPAWPATRPVSHRPLEASEATVLGGPHDGGKPDNASSVTLQDKFPWHQVGVSRNLRRLPSTIVPTLLQSMSDLSLPQPLLDEEDDGARKANEDSNLSGEVAPRYSAVQKGKWKARKDVEVEPPSRRVGRSPSPQFHFDGIDHPVERWVMHNRPILQEYADRQSSLPLGRRVELSIDEPSQLILGVLQLLVNRDRKGNTHPSRRLGPQLFENFADIDRWAKEYFRSRHGTQAVDSDVPTLLTVVINNFYEGQVQLIDRLVEFALENMRLDGRSSLGLEDFAFGFDFKMSQDLPFCVETSSMIREPRPVRAVEVPPSLAPVITSSGRQVKPTKRAQAASEQTHATTSARRDKGRNTSTVKDKRATNGSAPVARQKNNPTRLSLDRTAKAAQAPPEVAPRAREPTPLKTTPERVKHRPIRPSNLGLPPITPGVSSSPGNTASRSSDRAKTVRISPASKDGPNAPVSSGSDPVAPPRLKIALPVASLSATTAAGGSGSTLHATGSSTPTFRVGASVAPSETTNSRRGASSSGGARPARAPTGIMMGYGHGRARERGRGSSTRKAEVSAALPVGTTAAPQTARQTSAGGTATSATIDPPAVRPSEANAPGGTLSPAPGTRQNAADDPRARGGRPSPRSQRPHTEAPLPPPKDPGHSRHKKRKLDDCDD